MRQRLAVAAGSAVASLTLMCVCLCVVPLPRPPSSDAVAVPKSLQRAACHGLGNSSATPGPDDPCFAHFTYHQAYCLFLGLFACVIGPFCFFNVQKTKALQVVTSVLRWTTFLLMIGIAVSGIVRGKGFRADDPPPPPVDAVAIASVSGLKTLFGVSIYSFMCHHSLPSLVTPIKPKTGLPALLALDFACVAAFYYLLCFTAVFRFPADALEDLYTLNFKPFPSAFVAYFLALFPVFTLRSVPFPSALWRDDPDHPLGGRGLGPQRQLPHHRHHAAQQPQDAAAPARENIPALGRPRALRGRRLFSACPAVHGFSPLWRSFCSPP